MFTAVLGVHGKGTVRRGWGCLVPDAAGSRLFQPAPMDPMQDTAETLRQDSGTSGKMDFRKGKMLHGSVRGKENSVRNNSANTEDNEEEGGAGAPGAGAEIIHSMWCSPW